MEEIIDSAPEGNDAYPEAGHDSGPEGQGRPAENQNQQNIDHLAEGLDFSERTRCDHLAPGNGNKPETVHAQFAGKNQDRNPRRSQIQPGEHDQCGKNEQLIGNRIDELAENRNPLIFPCKMTVQKIGKGSQGKNGSTCPRAPWLGKGKKKDDQRNAKNPKNAQTIGPFHKKLRSAARPERHKFR